MRRVFVSDCEGPISKNDNAYELAANFIPNGDCLFANISKYDDVLADVLRKPGYSAGSTLRLILPFFKAYGVTDRQIEEFSAQNILLIPGTQAALRHIQAVADAFIVSTSYEHYIRALCNAVGFPFKNTYCTKVSLDKTAITPKEKERLREIAQEIAQMRLIDIPPTARHIEDFSLRDQALIQRLDDFFWSELAKMFVGKFLTDVITMGGEQKALAIRDVAGRLGVELSDVMYVGDSITDVEAFKLVHAGGGLSVSFNGNGYAVKNAEVAVLSESNLVTAVIADLFCKHGKTQTLEMLASWSLEALEGKVDAALLKQLSAQGKGLPKAQIVTAENMESLTKESCEFRRKVRGVAIGGLG
ncbi:MAG: HAD hydrolase family protein [Candidatus Bathyarchaeota archaeon]|nr:HAD hydrolase family protein [Candidatus Bathyarchaeota archaeon]